MKTIIEAFDDELGVDVIPVNLPLDYKPEEGQIIETTDGNYEVKNYIETSTGGFIARISLTVRKVR